MGDRLYVNARIRTGDRRRPWADAMLVRDGRVIAVGSSAEMRKLVVDVVVIDALGAEMKLEEREGMTPGDTSRGE